MTPANQQAITQWLYEWVPDIALAVIILIVAHFAAKAVKWAIANGDRPHPVLLAP